ncbi:MAG TPA: hypothetical protein VFN35_29035, partial [Ktedonobacteraceae bacterium]|nr:hypothetical protein [Ktedonobacteraceae bacterium]
AEEFLVVDGDSILWQAIRPLLDVALRMDNRDETFIWHGWGKSQLSAFLEKLPSPCSLLAGVWETIPASPTEAAHDKLVVGLVCEIIQGELHSLRTFESLVAAGLKPTEHLEIGMEDALEIIHYARRQVAPVAWALFTDKTTWDEWLFTSDDGKALDKGALLNSFANAGRCVLMGSQVASL